MTKVYLHVGMPKCASSTLQAFFKENEKGHVKSGFCYPKSFRTVSGYFSHRPLHNVAVGDLENAVESIAQEASEEECDTIFLSSEEFVNSLWDKRIFGSIMECLNSMFGAENVKVLFLVRNHFAFVESVYAQFLKAGMFRVPNDVFFARADNGIIGYMDCFKETNGFDFFEYSSFLQRFRESAPRNKFEVVSIESSDHQGKDVVEYFCSLFGLKSVEKKKSVNIRFKGKTLLAFHHARMNYPYDDFKLKRPLFNKVFRSSGDGFSSRLHLSGDAYERVLEASKRDRLCFQKNFGSALGHVFSIPEGFPRNLDNEMALNKSEVEAVDYIMSVEEPSVDEALKMVGGKR